MDDDSVVSEVNVKRKVKPKEKSKVHIESSHVVIVNIKLLM